MRRVLVSSLVLVAQGEDVEFDVPVARLGSTSAVVISQAEDAVNLAALGVRVLAGRLGSTSGGW